MGHWQGQITEVWEEGGELAGVVTCPAQSMPAAGQYLLAREPTDHAAPLSHRVIPSTIGVNSFTTSPGLPRTWAPGTILELAGPLGRGFTLPETARHAAFACLGGSPAWLRPVVQLALSRGCAAVLYADGVGLSLDHWPTALEAAPLASFPEVLQWADFLALAASPAGLARLRDRLSLPPRGQLPFPAQALIDVPVPCGGMADCGVCAVKTRRGYLYACRDGPVFHLNELEW